MPSNLTNLVTEAGDLIARLDARIAACYVEHPHLGEIPAPGTSQQIRKLKQVRHRAVRRLNRRKHAAGLPLTIAGAMWIINQADSGYF